ncbi:hypothetical protein [Natrinema hispanicum]|uniref:Uncharacterized protein n=1 Tax=Natrinema hispanicum TaxID=392421 RepID=A0A1I0G6J6_9EURY|nr:hypothetical protein [Natrinema hispanicum]RZV08102.1 hypothetical protein BDK88_3065 [Natrinema hispanicum]SDD37768.1 hypothetical protein SAMN05192552_102046 [Natrinema hispanicum]SET66410.1 hypothetical protein SAMN04488694_11014 [Natrinema hispanicum]
MDDDRTGQRAPVVLVLLLVGIGVLLYSTLPSSLFPFVATVFAPAAILLLIWAAMRLSVGIRSA